MRLGEATRKIDTKPGQRNDISNLAETSAKSKNETLKELGINDGLASRAEQLARNPDLIEAEIERGKITRPLV